MSQQAKKGDRRVTKRFLVSGCLATVGKSSLMAVLGLGPKSVGEVLDLNSKGARLRLSERVPLFEVFRVTLQQVQGGHKVGGIKARTVWEKPDAGKFQIGLHFIANAGGPEGVQEILRRCRTKAQAV